VRGQTAGRRSCHGGSSWPPVKRPPRPSTTSDAFGAVELYRLEGEHGELLVAQAHGWRTGRVRDPFGHDWELARPVTGA
jgi:hypothetical protein